jgi:hypothetical protein
MAPFNAERKLFLPDFFPQKSTIRRIGKQQYQFIEESIRKQFHFKFDPEEIEQLARSTQFVQRQGELSGFTFFCLMVFNSDSLSSESLNDLTAKLKMDYGIDITKQSLDERFNEYAVSFLQTAIGELLSKQMPDSMVICDQFKRILIKDSVCFQVDESLAQYYPGSGGSGSKANVRIQFEYDLLTGRVVDLSLNGFNDQDSSNSTMTLEVINEGDLIIRDLAYMHFTALKGILANLGDFLCRLQSSRNVYQYKDGNVEKLDFIQIVKLMESYEISKFEDKVFLDKNRSLEVRLLFFLLPQEVYQARIRKAAKYAKKKGTQLTKEYKARAKLNLFITSAAEYVLDLESVWKAYTLRWQIELWFKVWKSLWKIDKVKKVKKERLECYIWSKLFVIILCQHALWVTQHLLGRYDKKSLSFYKASKTMIKYLAKFKQALLEGSVALAKFLADFFVLSRRKHLLEKKRGGNFSPEILMGTFTIRYDGEVMNLS